MAAQPHFFLVRPSLKQVTADGEIYTELGAIVPLVPVDELPEWLDIPSAPRNLPVERIVGLSNVGILRKSEEPYAVEIIQHDEAHCGTRTSGMTASIHNPQQTPPPRTQSKPSTTNNNTTTRPSSSASTNTNTNIAHCRHWCRYGTCKYGLGCHHLHAMPTTAAEMAAAGLREIPAWWAATGAGAGAGAGAGVGAGVDAANPTLGANLQPHPQPQQRQQQQQQRQQQHHKQQVQQQLQELSRAQQARRRAKPIHQDPHAGQGQGQGHNHDLPSTGTGTGSSSNAALDPRDVRYAAAQQRMALAQQANVNANANANTHAGGVDASGGGGAPVGGMSNRAMKAQQMQATVALMKDLGLDKGEARGGGGGGGGGGGSGHVRPKRREINPLQKVRGNGVVNKGVVLRGGEADLDAAFSVGSSAGSSDAASDAGRQMPSGLVTPDSVRDDVAERGYEGGAMRQHHHVAEKVEKLIDV